MHLQFQTGVHDPGAQRKHAVRSQRKGAGRQKRDQKDKREERREEKTRENAWLHRIRSMKVMIWDPP